MAYDLHFESQRFSKFIPLMEKSPAADFNVVGIVGLGYVGLPLALRFSQVGLRVIGFDVDVHSSIPSRIASAPT